MGDSIKNNINPLVKNRNTGLDLLRCLAMLMVVVLHYLGKGGLLPDMNKPEGYTGIGFVAWLIEAICIVAVNVYMLISGYVLAESHFKLSRLLGLYFQLWFYSVLVGLVCYKIGIVPAEEWTTYNKLSLVLPVSMGHYWFMTAYLYFYILLPVLGIAVKKMSRAQLGTVIIIMLVVHSILKSILPFVLEMDGKGYDFLWYTVLFLLAAYIRLHNPKFMKRGICLAFFVVGVFGAFAEIIALGYVCMKTGRLEYILTVSMHYNHIFPLLASVGIFGLFAGCKVPEFLAKGIGLISPFTLGVYLLHENIMLRYEWPKLFGCENINSVPSLVVHVLLAAIVVFIVGIVIDGVRSLIFKGLHALFMLCKPYKALYGKIKQIDDRFSKG